MRDARGRPRKRATTARSRKSRGRTSSPTGSNDGSVTPPFAHYSREFLRKTEPRKAGAEFPSGYRQIGARCVESGTCGPRSERVPGGVLGEFQVADIDAEPRAHAAADRHDIDGAVGDFVVGEHRHAEPAHQVGGAVHPDIAAVEGERIRQIVDQHHGAGAVAAEIEADRRPLPIDLPLPLGLGMEHAVAVARAGDEGAGTLLADDIAVWQAVALHRPLHQRGQSAGDRAEEAVPGADDLVRRIGVVLGVRRRGGEGEEEERREAGEEAAGKGHG